MDGSGPPPRSQINLDGCGLFVERIPFGTHLTSDSAPIKWLTSDLKLRTTLSTQVEFPYFSVQDVTLGFCKPISSPLIRQDRVFSREDHPTEIGFKIVARLIQKLGIQFLPLFAIPL